MIQWNRLPVSPEARTILHVEDEPALAQLVEATLKSLGFRGQILRASLVADAIALLDERERRNASLDLILVDMQLPDGNGLEVLRVARDSPLWRSTPVIVLSGETTPSLINEAYALGANCYLPKLSRTKGALGSIQVLYQCWIEGALLPKPVLANQVRKVVAKSVSLRARTAQFYFGLARASRDRSDEEIFWLGRALTEGNMSNLLAFLQGQIEDDDVPAAATERATGMQLKVERALSAAEKNLAGASPSPTEICRWVLALVETWDEEVMAEAIGAFMPKSPIVTAVFQSRAVCQLRQLADHVKRITSEPELHRRADSLLACAGRLETLASR